MALIVTDHLSSEIGHLRGVGRVLTTLGMVLVALGVLVFFAAVVVGLFAAGDGTSSASSSVQLLPIGGGGVLVGSFVAALGITLARRSAGE